MYFVDWPISNQCQITDVRSRTPCLEVLLTWYIDLWINDYRPDSQQLIQVQTQCRHLFLERGIEASTFQNFTACQYILLAFESSCNKTICLFLWPFLDILPDAFHTYHWPI